MESPGQGPVLKLQEGLVGVAFIPTRFSTAFSVHSLPSAEEFWPYPLLKVPIYYLESSEGTTFWILHEKFLHEAFPDFLHKFPSLTGFLALHGVLLSVPA